MSERVRNVSTPREISLRVLTNIKDKLRSTFPLAYAEYRDMGDQARTENFVALIVDIDDKATDGIYTPKALRKSGVKAPIIGATEDQYVKDEWSERCTEFMNQGGDYLLRAPVNPRELDACLNAINRRSASLPETMLAIKNGLLKVNLSDGSVWHRHQPIPLTHQESIVFAALARNPNRILSKSALMDALYPHEGDRAKDKTLDVFICKIRAKLDNAELGLSHTIETVWGTGYRLVT